MERLPVEVWTKIFSYLKVGDCLRVSEVCWHFHWIINSKVFLRDICANFTDVKPFEATKRRYLNLKIKSASHESLSKCNRAVRRSAASVIRLEVEEIWIRDVRLLTSFLSSFRNLQELHLEGIHIVESTWPVQLHFQHLKILKFFYSKNYLLQMFTQSCHQLQVFKICLLPHEDQQSRDEHYELMMQVLRNNRWTLEKLNLYDVNFDDAFLHQLSLVGLHRLQKFSMSFNAYLTADSTGLEKFVKAQAHTLQKFKIRTFDHINEDQLEVLISNVPNIKYLNIIVCANCDYQRFSDFRKLTQLEKLKIQPKSFCTIEAPDNNYNKFIERKILRHQNDRMKHLTLNNLNVTKEVLDLITASFSQLEVLDLSYGKVAIDHVIQLQQKLAKLDSIKMNGCVLVRSFDDA